MKTLMEVKSLRLNYFMNYTIIQTFLSWFYSKKSNKISLPQMRQSEFVMEGVG